MKRPLMAAAWLCVAFLWILLAAGGESPFYRDSTPAPAEGEEVLATGQICQIDGDRIWIRSVILSSPDASEPTNLSAHSQSRELPQKMKLICEMKQDLSACRLGMQITLRGTFALFSEGSNPGEFDSFRYYRSLGVQGKIQDAALLQRREDYWVLRDAAYRLRLLLEQRIQTLFPEEEGTVMCALLLGDKKGLDREYKDLYKRNGILHILSISSLHITIIGMSLYRLLRKCSVPIVPAALAGAALLLFYGAMTGFALSAVRAIGMYCLRMFAEIVGRTYDMLTALGVLAACMVLYRPYYLENAGFLLSFAAVLGIGVIYPALRPNAEQKVNVYAEKPYEKLLRKGREGLTESALASISITLATLPIQLWFYYEVPVFSVLVNLLVLPFVRPLLILGICCLVPGLGFLAWPDVGILNYYEKLCLFFDRFSLRTWNPGKPQGYQVTVYYLLLGVALVWLYHWRKKEERLRELNQPVIRLKSILKRCIPLALPFIFVIGSRPGDRVLFLDVGQGSSVLILNASGENYLFDCGSSSRSSVGQYVLLPCLKYFGIHRLDAVFISHPDRDHMNGILELPALAADHNLEILQVILPAIREEDREAEYAEILDAFGNNTAEEAKQEAPGEGQQAARPMQSSVRIAYLSAGDSWQCGENTYTCLHPEKNIVAGDTNAYSQCLFVEFANFELLLTGDVPGEGEEQMTDLLNRIRQSGGYRTYSQTPETKNTTQNVEETGRPLILQVAHHGSSYSTSAHFLQAIRPTVSIISAGSRNRYGHPHAETLQRLKENGAEIYRTDQCGAIEVRGKGKKAEIMVHGGG